MIPIALVMYAVQWPLADVCIRCFHLKGNRARVFTALPAIPSVAMLSKQNGFDGDYTLSAVMLITVACLFTLPLVSLGLTLIG